MASISKRTTKDGSTRYVVRFRAAGKTKEKWFPTLTAAKSFRGEVDQKRARGETIDLASGRVPLRDYVRNYLDGRPEGNITNSTRSQYEWAYSRLGELGDLPIAGIGYDTVQRWINRLARELSPNSVRRCHALVHMALGRAHKRGHISKVATDPEVIELPRVEDSDSVRSLTVSEVADIAHECGPYRDFVWAGALTGARISELVAITEDRIEGDWLTIDRQLYRYGGGSLRGDDGQLVFSPVKTRNSTPKRKLATGGVLAKIIAKQELGEVGLLFTNTIGGPVHANNFRRRVWHQACETVLGERIDFHSLRHSNDDWLRLVGCDPRVIADRLGHSTKNLGMTFGTYASSVEELALDAAHRIDMLVASYLPEDLRPEQDTEVEAASKALEVLSGLDEATLDELRALLTRPVSVDIDTGEKVDAA